MAGPPVADVTTLSMAGSAADLTALCVRSKRPRGGVMFWDREVGEVGVLLLRLPSKIGALAIVTDGRKPELETRGEPSPSEDKIGRPAPRFRVSV